MTPLDVVWRERTDSLRGCWSLRVVGGGFDIAERSDVVHPAASIIKLPILVTIAEFVDNGALDMAEHVRLNKERVHGAGALQYLDLESVTLRQALALMVTISDNVATNALIDHVGMSRLREAWASPLFEGFELNRYLGTAPRSPENDNFVCADAAVRCLMELVRREQQPAAGFAISLLAQQQVRDRIPARLPHGVACLNKTGELRGVRHDVALLRSGSETAAIAMLASGLPTAGATFGGGEAAQVMAHCAAAIAQQLLRNAALSDPTASVNTCTSPIANIEQTVRGDEGC